jgi:hypothetical protein
MEDPQKLKIELPYDPVIPLLGIFLKECKSGHNNGTCAGRVAQLVKCQPSKASKLSNFEALSSSPVTAKKKKVNNKRLAEWLKW